MERQALDQSLAPVFKAEDVAGRLEAFRKWASIYAPGDGPQIKTLTLEQCMDLAGKLVVYNRRMDALFKKKYESDKAVLAQDIANAQATGEDIPECKYSNYRAHISNIHGWMRQTEARLAEAGRQEAANERLSARHREVHEDYKAGDTEAGLKFLYEIKAHMYKRDEEERSFDTYKTRMQMDLCSLYRSFFDPEAAAEHRRTKKNSYSY